jgi:hypothetical protein
VARSYRQISSLPFRLDLLAHDGKGGLERFGYFG